MLTPHIHVVDVMDHMFNKERDTLLSHGYWRKRELPAVK